MMQVIKQTDKEKLAMYMKMPKKKIAEMLIQCNKVADIQYRASVLSLSALCVDDLPNCCEECNKKLEIGTVFCSADCRIHYYSN